MTLVSILINHWTGMQAIEKKYFHESWFINFRPLSRVVKAKAVSSHNLTWTEWVQFQPAPTHNTCLLCSVMSCLMKLACLIHIRLCQRYFEIKIFWQQATRPFSGTAKACWWSTLIGNFHLTLEMKILDNNVVSMSGLLLAEAISMAGAGHDYVAAKSPSPSKQMSPPSSNKGRDWRDVKKLCSSQDPVNQNSRCETISNNWSLQLFWLCSLFLDFQVRARNSWTSHWKVLIGLGGWWVKWCNCCSCW
jgi:hypothetical protein